MTESSPTFLTPEEIRVLTGYTRKADQRRELRALGIKFLVNRTGRPVVLRQALAEHFGVRDAGPCMPDLEALEALDRGKTT